MKNSKAISILVNTTQEYRNTQSLFFHHGGRWVTKEGNVFTSPQEALFFLKNVT
jgi:hypothetical protein